MKTCPNCKAALRPWKEGDPMPPQTPVHADGKPKAAVQVCDQCKSSWIGVG